VRFVEVADKAMPKKIYVNLLQLILLINQF
jgi:hypothetical protein